MNSPFKFLRRVRIHGGECGAVARALHHEAQKVALTRNEQTLISDEKAFSRQADLKKAFGSTSFERKQMSTKTTLKRIALVAVSALGFGVLSAVAPASAATASFNTASLTVGTIPTAQVGSAVKVPITLTAPASTLAAGGSDTVTVNVRVTSAPTGSALKSLATFGKQADGSTAGDFISATYATGNSVGASIGFTASSGGTVSTTPGLASDKVTVGTNWTTTPKTAAQITAGTMGSLTVNITPDVAGSYTVLVSTSTTYTNNATAVAAAYTAGDTNISYTFTTGGAVATATLATVTGNSTAGSATGQIIKVTLKDASGAVAQLAPNETLSFSNSGAGTITYVGLSTVDGSNIGSASATYTATSANFTNGVGYFRYKNSAAETNVATLTGSGLLASTITSTLSLVTRTADSTYATGVFTDSTTQAAAIALGAGGHTAVTGTYSSTASKSATSHSYKVTYGTAAAAAGNYVALAVVDTSGKITGVVGGTYTLAVATTTTTTASFSITATLSTAGNSFTVTTGGATLTVTSATAAITDITKASPTVNTYNTAVGSSQTFTMKVVDQFGAAMANEVFTVARTGRNATTTSTTLISDANGLFTYTYTDAGTAATANKTDTVTVTSSSDGTVTEVYTVNFGTFTPASISCLTGNESDTSISVTYRDISSDDGAEAGAASLCTVTVKDANGAVIVGVPVTTTTASAGAAVVSTSATLYTGTAGTVAPSVYGWTNGTKTFTITAGAITKTVTVNYLQQTNTEVRSIAATLSGNVIKVTASDRFGNPVPSVRIYGTRTGNATFGGGSATANAITGNPTVADATLGVAEFVVVPGTSASTFKFQVASAADTPSASYGYTSAVKGSSDDGTTALTAYVAGTATKAEVGVGSSFDAAGVNSVTVAVAAGVDAGEVAANAAADAALEAIDAATAATDAANLAAEAADAATMAAQDAKDAADAATAAVEKLAQDVATMIDALKAQLATLANVVAKIAKKVKA